MNKKAVMHPTCRIGAAAIALAALAAPAVSANGLLILGTRHEGGAANAFQTIIDLREGHDRTTVIRGDTSDESGFDGIFWEHVNGATNFVDLPPVVADRLADDWVRQAALHTIGKPGELTRKVSIAGASPIELAFDPATHRIAKATIAGEYGPVAISFGDWRPVGPFQYPFRQETVGDEGEQIDVAQSVRLIPDVDASLLARPPEAPVAELAAEAVTVPFVPTGRAGSHLQVAAALNGKPATFIFDTGGANILTTDAAKRFGIAASGGMNIGGVGEGTEAGGFGLVDKIALGGASLADQAFIIIPSFFPPDKNGKPTETAGLLGYEFLAHFVTTIDYRAQTMTFRRAVPSNQRGARLPFFSDGHGIIIGVTIGGKPGLVGLDTGDGGTLTIFPAFAAASHLDDGKGEIKSSGGGVGGALKETAGALDHFAIAGVDSRNLPVRFSKNEGGAFASSFRAGNLGGSILRCFRITIDFPHHQLWLEPQLDTPRCALAAPKG